MEIKKKEKNGRYLVVCTSLKMKVEEKRYFHSGNSRRMTGNRELFTNLQPCNLESITFGNGGTGTVLGSGAL